MSYSPCGSSESLTVSTAAVPLASIVNSAIRAVVSVHDQPIRFLVDGGTPTSSFGHLANDEDVIVLKGRNQIKGFKAIREGGTDSTLTISYFSGSPDSDDSVPW